MFINKIKLKILILFSTLFISSLAHATLDLELTQGLDSAIPIAVMPFTGQEAITNSENNVPNVIGKDLQNSGQFRLADVSNLLPNLKGSDINYDYWHDQKVNDVIIGQVSRSGNQYQVAFKLIDVYNKTTLLDRKYTVKEEQLRSLAHHISDLVYQQLTGIPGIFSTKIAYILVQRSGGTSPRMPITATYHFEVADADGHNPHTMLISKQPLMSPAWSPDGKKIAYVSFEGNRAAIYVQDIASGRRQIVSKHPGINGAPAWSPDSKKMALVLSDTGYPKIYIVDIGSNKSEQITNDWYLDTEPSWAKDGQSIIFTSNRGGNPQIYRIYLDSKKIERVTYSGNYNARASFTPDGKSIVMLHQDGDMFNIAIQDIESGRLNAITKSGNDESPSIAPNGKMVVYATNDNNRGVLGEVSTDGRVKLMLPAREGEVQEPAWGPLGETKN